MPAPGPAGVYFFAPPPPNPAAIRPRGCARIAGVDRDARSELLSMMALVAGVVAIVILVFFAIGYLFGRLFL